MAENGSKSCVSVYELWQRTAVSAVCQFMNCSTVAENGSKTKSCMSVYELWQRTTVQTVCQVMNCGREQQ